MPILKSPLSNRKINTAGAAYKKVIESVRQDPSLLYKCRMEVFAQNYIYLEHIIPLPPYDPAILGYYFRLLRVLDTKQIVINHVSNRFEGCRFNFEYGEKDLKHPIESSSLFKRADLTEGAVSNECYLSTRDTLDSWIELPPWRLLITEDKYAFDLYYLVKLVTNQINEIKGGNPFPVCPFNPFTGNAFSSEFLAKVQERLHRNRINVSRALQIVLTLATSASASASPPWDHYAMVNEFTASGLRFVKEFDVQLMGYWAEGDTPSTFVEDVIIPILETPGMVVESIDMFTVPFLQPESYYYVRSHSR